VIKLRTDILDNCRALETLRILANAKTYPVFDALWRANFGLSRSELAASLHVHPDELSVELSAMIEAELISSVGSEKFFANRQKLRDLFAFLVDDCSGGKPDLCASTSSALGALARHG